MQCEWDWVGGGGGVWYSDVVVYWFIYQWHWIECSVADVPHTFSVMAQ